MSTFEGKKAAAGSSRGRRFGKRRWNTGDIALISMAAMGAVWLVIFCYLPMGGIALAFKDGNKALNIFRALFESEWTLNNFRMLFQDKTFWTTFSNTITINLLFLVFNFPMPILFALLMNEIRHRTYKTAIQTICNFPQFMSWVVYGGIVLMLTDASTGVVNPILEALGLSSPEKPIDLNLAQYFYPKIIIVTIIKGVGYGSIIYSAAIANIDPSYYEAAVMDGAGRFRCAISITIPSILDTIIVLLLLNIGSLLGNSFEQFYVFQSTENLSKTRVLATYIYSLGFTYRNYSTATALSLFEGIISLTLLLSANILSKKATGRGIF